MEAEKYRLCLFDGTNFGSWKFRLEAILDQHDLKLFIEEDFDVITNGKTSVEKEALGKQEKKCKAIIINHISDEQLEYIKDQKSAKGIIDTLKSVFERKTISSQLFIRKRLLTLKYQEDNDMNQYLLQFDKLIRELKESGANVDHSDAICHLLLSLPKSFEAVVAALETIDQSKLSLEFVKARLLDENNKRKNSGRITISSQHSTAFGTQSFRFNCYNCGRPGHKRSECRSKPKTISFNPQNKQPRNTNQYQNTNNYQSTSGNRHRPMSSSHYVANMDESEEEAVCFVAGSVSEHTVDDHIKWLLDSGASEHMANNEKYFFDLERLKIPIQIAVAKDKQTLTATMSGNIKILYHGTVITVNNVLYIPNLKFNLLSVSKLEEKGFAVMFSNGKATISRKNKVYLEAVRDEKLFVINVPFLKEQSEAHSVVSHTSDLMLWHRRYGHLNQAMLVSLSNKHIVNGLPTWKNKDLGFCEPCIKGKMSKLPYHSVVLPKSRRPLELVHSDVCGPITPGTAEGEKYFVTFIDDFTHFVTVHLLKCKSEVFKCFRQYQAAAEVQFSNKISRLRMDNGGEYISNEFKNFCSTNGIKMEYTIPYNPQQNGVSERFNRTLLDKARTMIADSTLPKFMWGEAVRAAAYIINRTPSKSIHAAKNITPAELWFSVKPDVSKMRVFGSVAYNHIPDQKRNKIDEKCEKLLMVGYAANGYRLWNMVTNTITIGRNVIFDEDSKNIHKMLIPYEDHSNTQGKLEEPEVENLEIEETEVVSVRPSEREIIVGEIEEVRQKRNIKKPLWQKDYLTIFENEELEENYVAYALNAENYIDADIPESVDDLVNHPDKDLWKSAMKEELEAMKRNNTWSLVDLPPGRSAINCKWVFSLKRNQHGHITRYRARLVAKGCSQRKGLDFNETYSPVVKLTTLRILLSIANEYKFPIHQMDFKTAFLNGDLSETIYMKQPPGCKDNDKVCKLNKTIYGLKQSSREWYHNLTNILLQEGFNAGESDKCLFTKIKDKILIYVLIYVDDLLLISNNLNEMSLVKQSLSKAFEMKDMGEIKLFLGINIDRDIENRTLTLSQSNFIERLLIKFNMNNCKVKSTPIETNLKLKLGMGTPLEAKPYRELIGCLTYLAVTTRADISFAVSYFSRFQSQPTEETWSHLKRILRYLKKTPDLKLVYSSVSTKFLEAYSDSDWASEINTRKSTSGCVIKVFGNLVQWASRKQNSVALSSCEAEYVALSSTITEVLWVQKVLFDLGFQLDGPTEIFEDNQSVIFVANQDKCENKLKHIDIKLSFVQDIVRKNLVKISYVESKLQQADIFTKGLNTVQFNKILSLLGYE